MEKLEQILAAKNVGPDQIAVRGSSHLGGHKYAGVVTVYPDGDWYGMLTGRNAEELVDAYLQNKRLEPNFRGNALRNEFVKNR
jgi:hypothetical protein